MKYIRRVISYFFFSFIIITLYMCSDNSTTPDNGFYTVQGFVSNSQGIVAKALVVIDNSANWSTLTDNEGYFEFSDVPEGSHTLTMQKINDDGGFTETEQNLIVNADVLLDALKLPKPLSIHEPTEITSSSIKLVWDKSDALDFYEYKLYRHEAQGLDETTGELIFVSIARSDTTFIDENLFSNKNYFYRVYQMNDIGRLGGSNIVSATTVLENLIPDGGFEELDNLEKYWFTSSGDTNNVLEITDSIKFSGYTSLHASFNGTYPHPRMELDQILNIAPNTQYEISIAIKVDGNRQNTDDFFLNLKQGSDYIPVYFMIPITDAMTAYVNSEWSTYTKRFTTLDNNQLKVTFDFFNNNVWIDDFSIKPVE